MPKFQKWSLFPATRSASREEKPSAQHHDLGRSGGQRVFQPEQVRFHHPGRRLRLEIFVVPAQPEDRALGNKKRDQTDESPDQRRAPEKHPVIVVPRALANYSFLAGSLGSQLTQPLRQRFLLLCRKLPYGIPNLLQIRRRSFLRFRSRHQISMMTGIIIGRRSACR
jgi:hypothetical protein